MKKVLLFIVSLPLLVLVILVTPVTIGFAFALLPLVAFIGIIDWLKNNFDPKGYLEFWLTFMFLGIVVYFDVIWNKELFEL